MDYKDYMIIFLMIMCLTVSGLSYYSNTQQKIREQKINNYYHNEIEQQIEKNRIAIASYKMYNANEYIRNSKTEWGINGVAFLEEGFYCVSYNSTNDTNTNVHEKAHFFIDKDYEHFCNNGW